jgi:hypothetical protein
MGTHSPCSAASSARPYAAHPLLAPGVLRPLGFEISPAPAVLPSSRTSAASRRRAVKAPAESGSLPVGIPLAAVAPVVWSTAPVSSPPTPATPAAVPAPIADATSAAAMTTRRGPTPMLAVPRRRTCVVVLVGSNDSHFEDILVCARIQWGVKWGWREARVGVPWCRGDVIKEEESARPD